MTDSYLEIQAYVERLELYLWLMGALFTVAVAATAYLFFGINDEEGDDE